MARWQQVIRQQLRPLRIRQLRWGRRWQDWRRRVMFANAQSPTPLPVVLVHHQSVLLRRLGDTDPQLQHNKVVNLGLAVPHLHGLLIPPGATISIWHRVGYPSAGKGYQPGVQLSQGKVSVGIGGGLCQLANLIHWMGLHTPLELIERHHHSFDAFPDSGRLLPFGSGASLFYNYRDLRFRNPTSQTMQLMVWLSDTHLCGEIRAETEGPYAYEVVEKDHRFEQEGDALYRCNSIWQRRLNPLTNACIDEHLLYSNRSRVMYDIDL
ncbi:MAG: VanW family protein [Synechococcus sp.]|nr:VanW family protein [Synechococcus sp.]